MIDHKRLITDITALALLAVRVRGVAATQPVATPGVRAPGPKDGAVPDQTCSDIGIIVIPRCDDRNLDGKPTRTWDLGAGDEVDLAPSVAETGFEAACALLWGDADAPLELGRARCAAFDALGRLGDALARPVGTHVFSKL